MTFVVGGNNQLLEIKRRKFLSSWLNKASSINLLDNFGWHCLACHFAGRWYVRVGVTLCYHQLCNIEFCDSKVLFDISSSSISAFLLMTVFSLFINFCMKWIFVRAGSLCKSKCPDVTEKREQHFELKINAYRNGKFQSV